MVNTVLAQKKDMQQVWTTDGTRLVVTKLYLGGNVVVRPVSTNDDTMRVQIAFGDKKAKNMAKAQRDQLAAAKITTGKRVFTETTATETLEAGRDLLAQDVLEAGQLVKITGISKGKGFTGVVKRWGFAGGPRTHGQSDRERAPGSIGAGTTPGRVWPGKKMAGHSGVAAVTLENMPIVAINPEDQTIWVKGTIPGAYNSIVRIRKQDGNKRFELNETSQDLLGLPKAAATEETTEEAQA